MGNREALLAGAKKSLLEKGYDRTTVRDITAAAGGVSMAAIGYHFGSREALLTAALVEAIEEWGDAAMPTAAATDAPKGAPRSATPTSYRRWWSRMIEAFGDQRPLWLASVEAFLQAERSPEVRRQLADGNEEARRGLAAWILGEREDAVDDKAARGIGSVQVALISGLMIQWINDPDRAPTAADVVRGLREIATRLESSSTRRTDI